MTNLILDPDLLPTDADVARYREDGCWLSGPILPGDVLDAAEEGMRRFYAGDHDAPFPGRTRFDDYDWTPGHGAGLRKNDYARMQVRELDALVRHPAIAAVAARLSGSATIRLWHDQLLYKPPSADSSGNVGWHTDRQYWATCTSEEMLTAWVPFHDCDETTGSVTFLAGSHRWPRVDLDFFDQDLGRLEREARDLEVRPVVARLPRGCVSFHHCRTVHGSGPNRSAAPRRSMAIHLQPGDNRYRAVSDAAGEPAYHRNDDLVRRVDGVPDYADPRVCPVLHPPAPAS